MSEDIEVFFENSSEGSSYLESLIKSRLALSKLTNLQGINMITKIEEVILLELELAKMGAEKARSEILKANSKDNVKPIK